MSNPTCGHAQGSAIITRRWLPPPRSDVTGIGHRFGAQSRQPKYHERPADHGRWREGAISRIAPEAAAPVQGADPSAGARILDPPNQRQGIVRARAAARRATVQTVSACSDRTLSRPNKTRLVIAFNKNVLSKNVTLASDCARCLPGKRWVVPYAPREFRNMQGARQNSSEPDVAESIRAISAGQLSVEGITTWKRAPAIICPMSHPHSWHKE